VFETRRWSRGVLRALGLALAAAVGLASAPAALALDEEDIVYPGPYLAEVTRVYDGDTVTVLAHIWPDHVLKISVRLEGIDTPEIRGRCQAEEDAAVQARDFVANIAEQENNVLWVRDVQLGKYAGRVLGRLQTRMGADVGTMLINNGLAVPYEQRREQRQRLCPNM